MTETETKSQTDRDERVRIGQETYNRVVVPLLKPEDDNKYVAVDIYTGEFEIDQSDFDAVVRLRARKPDAEIFLMRAGWPATCRARARLTFKLKGCNSLTAVGPAEL